MLNMAENLCINMIVNPTNTFVNPEAHTSLQLLHRRSSDEDDGDDDDEEETEDEQEQEQQEEEEEIEEENCDDTLVAELSNDHLNHSTAPPILSSSPSFPFSRGWGRGSRSISIVILFNFVF
jgi:hypothetical protein